MRTSGNPLSYPEMPKPARSFMDLRVWRAAHEMVLAIYGLSATFPRRETFGLTIQIRRAAVSVAANIAEGFRRRGGADKARFLNIAEGSLEEVRYYVVLANDLGYTSETGILTRLADISRLLHAYGRAIRTRQHT